MLLRQKQRRLTQFVIFMGSVFSVVPVFLVQYLASLFPFLNFVNVLQSKTSNSTLQFIILFVGVGIVEEIAKQLLLRASDRRYLLIQNINDSIHYSLLSALGFAFAENIFYFYATFSHFELQEFLVIFLFRSIFTTAGHLMFSGYLGYYYGIAKFALSIVTHNRLVGKTNIIGRWYAEKADISQFEAYKQLTILKGLFIAIVLHAVFNFFLQLNLIPFAVLWVVIWFFYLQKLLSQKTGRLILVSDPSAESTSTMAQKDEEVVLELLGMWFQQKRYVDVIHICQRLLERDPQNMVVQLFKTKALDKIESGSVYQKILGSLFPQK